MNTGEETDEACLRSRTWWAGAVALRPLGYVQGRLIPFLMVCSLPHYRCQLLFRHIVVTSLDLLLQLAHLLVAIHFTFDFFYQTQPIMLILLMSFVHLFF
jgi:hypothetical protein